LDNEQDHDVEGSKNESEGSNIDRVLDMGYLALHSQLNLSLLAQQYPPTSCWHLEKPPLECHCYLSLVDTHIGPHPVSILSKQVAWYYSHSGNRCVRKDKKH